MKKLILTLANLLILGSLFAQAPESMSYQAVARDLSGLPLISTTVNLQFDILQGSATGTATYSETQTKTTNQFGLFTAEIGSGTLVSGDFTTISWGTNAYYLRITVNGDVMPATQLLSVPYALYSKQSANGPAGVNGLNCWDTNGNGIQDAAEDINGDNLWDALDCQGGGATLIAGPGIDITGGVITSILDTSIVNEIQVLSVSNDTIFLSNGGFVKLPPSVGDNWGTDTVNISGNNITGNGTLANPLVVIDNDTSVINELQNLTWNTTDSNIIDLSDGTGIQLASNTPTANQVLTWNGTSWTAQALTGVWTQGTGNDIYNSTDSVGIGTTDPKSLFQLGDYTHISPIELSITEKYSSLTYNTHWDGGTLRNTTGGISAVSVMGDDNGNPVFTWLLFPAQPVGTDMLSISPDLRMNLRGQGLAINSDVANAGLDVVSIDSASILMDVPDDNSQPTLSYRAPGGAQEILGLRVPNTLINSYTLTYPTDLPVATGSSLVSDLTGNLSWASPITSPWTRSLNLIFPTTLTDNVGIGMNAPAAKLDVLSTTTENLTIATQIVNDNIGATDFRGLYVLAQSGGTASEYVGAEFQAFGPGGTGNAIGLRASASGGAANSNWAAYFEAGNVYIENNIGIGTDAPSYPIELNKNLPGSAPLMGVVNTNAAGDASVLFSTITGDFMMGVDGNTFKIASSSTNLALNTRMTIGSTGNVGFGVTAPTAKVHADGFGGEALRLQNSSVSTATMNVTNSAGGPAATFVNGTVGIGTLVPTARLQLNGTLRLQSLGGAAPAAGSVLTAIDANGNAEWQAPASGTDTDWTLGTGVVYNTVDNVGIGVIPTSRLNVAAGTPNPGVFFSQTGTGAALEVFSTTALDNQTVFRASSAGASQGFFVKGGGNVGIGITNPSVGLDMRGDETATVINADGGSPSTGMRIGNNNQTNNNYSSLGFTTTLSNISTVEMGKIVVQNVNHTLGSELGDMVFLTRNAVNLNEAMRIDGNGNVGIGTATPTNLLHISGNFSNIGMVGSFIDLQNTFGSSTSQAKVGILFKTSNNPAGQHTKGGVIYSRTSSNARGDIHFLNNSNDDLSEVDYLTDTKMIIKNDGNVGIGSTNPSEKLYISGGNFGMFKDDGSDLNITLNGDNNGISWTMGNEDSNLGYFKIASSGSLGTATRLTITDAGDVGIGTPTPTALLSVNGTANKTGGGAWTVFSDVRSKENVINYKKGLKELLMLRPVSFNYKSEFNWGDKTYVGLIAQEVEKIVPTMVEQKEVNGIKDFREVDPNEINYMLINAVKEQQKMIEELKQEIEALKK